MIPTGKGLYIWQVEMCGGPQGILERSKELGLNWLCVKIADGPYKFWKSPELIDETVRLLKANGFQVGGWHYIRLDDPAGEARIANQEVARLGLDFYSMDPEAEAKKNAVRTPTFVRALRVGDVGLCSYRYPKSHPELNWASFLWVTTFHQPQVYWEGAHNVGWQVKESYRQLTALKQVPFVPLGSAYARGSWSPTVGDLEAFNREAKVLQLSGIGYWSLDYLVLNRKQAWMDEIAAQPGWPVPGAPPEHTMEERVELLWAAHPELHHS